MKRGLAVIAVVTVGVATVVLAFVHTPWARNRALAWAEDFVVRFNLSLSANDLRYNAITRRITITDVRLAASGHEQRPFLIASRIEVRLPWTVFRGRFSIDHLEIDGGIVDIYRDENDVVNLPPGGTGPTPERPRRLNIEGLTLRGLDVQYTDMVRDWGIKVPRIESALLDTPLAAEGRFAILGETTVRIRERVMALAPIDAVMSFDGSNVSLQDARFVAPEINAVISGPIHRVLDSPSFDLAIAGLVNLDHATRWVPPPPVPIGGSVAIEGTLRGPPRDFVLDLGVTSNALAIGRERDVALSGPVRVTLAATSGDRMVLVPASGGEIRAGFNVPWDDTPPSSASAEWKGLDAQAALRLGDFEPQAIGATFDGTGEFTFGEPRRFSASNRAAPRPGRGVVPVSGSLTASLVGNDYRIEHAHRLPGLDFEGRTAGRLRPGEMPLTTLAGPAHVRISDVAEAGRTLESLGIDTPEIMQDIRGGVDAPMTLAGSFRDPRVDAAMTAEALDVPLLGRVQASAAVVADPREARVSAIDVRRGASTITGEVIADIPARTWGGTLQVEAPDSGDLQGEVPEAWRVTGPLGATAALGGTFDAYRLDTVITGTGLTWAGQPIDRAKAIAVVTGEAIDVTSLELAQGIGQLGGRIRYAWESGAYVANLKGDLLSWQGTVLAPNDTQAIFAVQFDGAGTTAQPKGQARVDFALTGGRAGALIGAGEMTAELLGDQARIVARLPEVGTLINAEVATAAPYDYRATALFDRFELARVAPLLGATPSEILGFASGTVTASGRLADARDRVALVNLTELDAGLGGVPVALNAPANLSLRDDDVTLKELDLRVGSGRLLAAGEWNTRLDGTFQGQFNGDFQDAIRMGRAFGVPVTLDGSGAMTVDLRSNGSRAGTLATLTLKGGTFNWGGGPAAVTNLNVDGVLQGESLTVSQIAGDVASGGVVGAFAANARFRVPELQLAAVDGELIVDTAKFTFSGIPVEQQRPSRVEFAGGAMAVADVSWSVANNPLVIGGSVGFAAADPPLNLSVQGLVDLRVLSAFVSTLAFDGNANINTLIEGSLSRPLLDGRVMLDGAQIAVSDPRLVLSELTGPIVLDGQRVIFDGVRGLANGGAIAVDGFVQTTGTTVAGGTVNIQAQGVAVELIRGLRSELDALVTYRPDPKAPSLTGDIRVVQSAYTETITLAALARRATLPISPDVERPYVDRIRLNLAVTTSEDITIDNNYGRLQAGASLRLVGTVAEPGIDGRITLREGGEVFLAGRTFRITRGDISFTELRRIQPEFNVAAEARIGGDNVTMTLTGTLERPSLDLTSEEGSRTPGEIAATIVGSNNTEAALTLISADLLGVTGRAIGLDAFRVERGEFEDPDFREDPSLVGANLTDPTTRLTIGKRLSDQVEFTVSQNLRESGNTTFIISYFPTRNVELRAVSRDNDTASFGVRHQITFGGGPGVAPIERRVPPMVSAVTFVGMDPALEAEVRDQISLDPGDRFDFLVLQQDVDRLQERFREQGFLEARIRTRRIEEPEAGTVAVEYSVDRGPTTILVVVGAILPANVIDELEEAWHRNVFDQFLIEDLTTRVRRHLVTTNELGSVVVGTVDRPSPDVKRLRIEVTAGAPVSGREIRFTGNQHFSDDRLTGEILAAGVEVEAWLDRTVVERTLLAAYNEQGFLKAQVAGQPLTIDGSVGVLPITIIEGPQAHITGIRWAGVGETRLPIVQEAAALETPVPYAAAAINDARVRIERRYREDGFNASQVNVVPDVADDDTVTLTFNIVEGPQQVLLGVETSGLEVTRGKVLTQALRFELGKPVDLDEWARARKRLYDTNVFRLVDIQPVPVGEAVDGVQPVRAQVTVEEYPTWSLRYGLQIEGERTPEIEEFTSSRNAGVVAEIKNPNLFGRALTLGLFGMYQYDRRDATLFLATSRLFGWRARSTLYGFVTRDRIRDEAGDQIAAITDQQGMSADQRWRTRGLQIVYGYRFQRSRTYAPVVGNDPSPLDFISNLAKLSSAVLVDRRDDPLNSRRGTFSSISFDQSSLWLGSDVDNRKLLMQQFAFVPLRSLVFASRVQAGLVFGPDSLLPIDRFLAGGATTVRGYGEDSLGPRDSFGLPSGGETLVILNQEVRFPIYRWVNGVGFVDAGNIFAKDESFSWDALKIGYGLGVRFDTPVGLLRVDFGIPNERLNNASGREPNSLRGGRWYFGIGHIF
jgi:outer membrane protein insertion porin family